jgi:hypothetical protein
VMVGRPGWVVGRPLIPGDVDGCCYRAFLADLVRLDGVVVSRSWASIRLESRRSEVRCAAACARVRGDGGCAWVSRRGRVAVGRRGGVAICRRGGVRIRLCGVRLRCRCRATPATSGPMLGQSLLLMVSLIADWIASPVGST